MIFFLKILDLINLEGSLQELLTKRRTRRFRRFYRNNKNWWETVSQTYSQKRFIHTFRVSRTKEYRLGRGDYLYTIAEMVGLAESTVFQIVVKVAKQYKRNYGEKQ